MQLTIGQGKNPFTLPLELATSTQAILARKRSGKSYLASVEAEELLEQKQQVVVIDPTGAWHGLRSSADGQGPGYHVVVFGGDHGDAPLDYQGGKAMARAVIEHGFSAIFDIGNLHTEEQQYFVKDFCSELLRMNRNAIHVFMDEADTFAPQQPFSRLSKECLGTVSRLVKQGGIRGVGFTMITQRPAAINKDVLSQVDILTVLRMSHPLDIKAATDWIKSEVTVAFAKDVEGALPSLPVGTAFFCSASLGIAKRVEVRTRRTFNSGATPKPGERKTEPKVLAQIDIDKLGKEISASVQRAKEESPEYLKKRIAELENEVAKGGVADMAGLQEHIAELERQASRLPELQSHVETMELRRDQFFDRLRTLISEFAEDADVDVELPTGHVPKVEDIRFEPQPLVVRPSHPPTNSNGSLTGPAQRILSALATLRAGNIFNPPRIHVCLLSGYGNLSSTGFVKALGQLRTDGLIDYPDAGRIALTKNGIAVAPKLPAMRSDSELHKLIYSTLGGPETRILEHLIKAYPQATTRESAMTAAGYSNLASTGFVKALGKLRTLGYIDYPSTGMAVATEQCFLPRSGR